MFNGGCALPEGAVYFGRVDDDQDIDMERGRPILSKNKARRKFIEFIKNFQSNVKGHDSMDVYKYRQGAPLFVPSRAPVSLYTCFPVDGSTRTGLWVGKYQLHPERLHSYFQNALCSDALLHDKRKLRVDLQDIKEYDMVLGDALENNPAEYLPMVCPGNPKDESGHPLELNCNALCTAGACSNRSVDRHAQFDGRWRKPGIRNCSGHLAQ